jgi:hypothetical protein
VDHTSGVPLLFRLLALPTTNRPSLVKEKQFSLYVLSVSDVEKKFYKVETCGQGEKLFSFLIKKKNALECLFLTSVV